MTRKDGVLISRGLETTCYLLFLPMVIQGLHLCCRNTLIPCVLSDFFFSRIVTLCYCLACFLSCSIMGSSCILVGSTAESRVIVICRVTIQFGHDAIPKSEKTFFRDGLSDRTCTVHRHIPKMFLEVL